MRRTSHAYAGAEGEGGTQMLPAPIARAEKARR